MNGAQGDVAGEGLAGERLFVEFPSGGVADWVAIAETLIEEGLRAWTVPADRLDLLADALAIFGYRARIGVSGVTTPGVLTDALASGAHYVTSPVWTPALQRAAGGAPWLPGALTPTEVAAALDGGATVVQVVPAEALGIAYPRTLTALLPGACLVATGRLDGALGEEWARAGVRALGVQGGIVLPESPDDPAREVLNDPGEVRRRARRVVQLLATKLQLSSGLAT